MKVSGKNSSRRSGGRSARIAQRGALVDERTIIRTRHTGCQYHALSEPDILRIHEGALKTLETVGMGVIRSLFFFVSVGVFRNSVVRNING